ncbi:ABC transporter ATP-binding protein [Pseudorhodoferax sp.]|uniref:ABC transporter ATP-binding protein n=1 Tax=Pseudorhodoferax sp. TaxID=1993553 RepID=UPI002DD6207B|nr:ABC transporter ATP-binding protein [Pseudorhodoferax sp.]
MLSAWARLRALGAVVLALHHDVLRLLEPRHRGQLQRIAALTAVFSLLEMAAAAAALSYVACLSHQECSAAERVGGFVGADPVVAYSLLLVLVMTVKMLADMLLHWTTTGFHQDVQQRTVLRLLEAYLAQGWAAYRRRNRAEYFQRCAVTAVDAAYGCSLATSIISSGLVVLVLSLLLIVANPVVSLLLVLGFLGLNLAVQRGIGRLQKLAAVRRERALRRWHRDMGEALDAFRELRIYGAERFFLRGIEADTAALAHGNRRLNFVPIIPRIALDYLAFTLLLAVVLAWLWTQRPLGTLLPHLVFYAVVARSILPAMMNLMGMRTALRGAVLSIRLVHEDLAAAGAERAGPGGLPSVPGPPALLLQRVCLPHPDRQAGLLRDVSLALARPAWVALVGPSGAGKSSLLEIVAGLQPPQSGAVVWRTPGGGPGPTVAYVPQHVAILDASLHDNVVFGLDAGRAADVQAALRVAQLHSRLDAVSGARLSGGERQRLAIARAVYRRPDLLLLDEATAALDEATEAALFLALRAALPGTTVVFVTHRQAALRFADTVWRLQDGVVEVQSP